MRSVQEHFERASRGLQALKAKLERNAERKDFCVIDNTAIQQQETPRSFEELKAELYYRTVGRKGFRVIACQKKKRTKTADAKAMRERKKFVLYKDQMTEAQHLLAEAIFDDIMRGFYEE